MRKYLSAKEISSLIGCTQRHVYRLAEGGGWLSRDFKQGGTIERRFSVLDLPTAVRQRMLPAIPAEPVGILSNVGPREDGANARLAAVQLMRDSRHNNGISLREFIARWEEIAPETLRSAMPCPGLSTLSRWDKALAAHGAGALVRRARQDKGMTTLPERWHSLVLSAYLEQSRRPMRAIYTHIIHKMALEELGTEAGLQALAQKKQELKKQVSEKVLRYFIKNHTATGMVSAARGLKGERDKVRPYISRTRANLASNDIWVSDGHDANNYVFDESGDIIRPVIVCWMDERSRLITGWSIGSTEHTDLIINSLAHGVEACGVPNSVYVDNGKAYINRRTAPKFGEEHYKTYAILGCNVITARPYNAREKTIERFWGTLDNNFSKFLPGYTGKDALSKPDSPTPARKLLNIGEYKAAFDKFITKYNTDSSNGELMGGQCPYVVYKDNLSSRRDAPAEVLIKMRLVHLPEDRVIRAGGVIRAQNREYIHEELIMHVGSKVHVAVDPDNLDAAYIYLNDELLAKARGRRVADFENTANTQAAFREVSKVRSKLNKHTKEMRELRAQASGILLETHAQALPSEVKKLPIIDITDF